MSRRFLALVALLLVGSLMLPFAARAQRPAEPAETHDSTTAQPAQSGAQRIGQQISPELSASKHDPYISYSPPQEKLLYREAQRQLGSNASQAELERYARQQLAAWLEANPHGPEQEALERLTHNEQRALAAGSSPAAMGMGVEGTLRLFTVAVEFNGTDTYENFSHPTEVSASATCITETVTFEGPLHNQILPPGPRDNNSFWIEDFDQSYYEKIVLSTDGLTERVRLDLTDPEDGEPGIDLSGLSMRTYFEEVSGGRVQFDTGPAGVIAWIQVPHSEGYYAANECQNGEQGRQQDMEGLPSNPSYPNGVSQLIKDIVDNINNADPNFPWPEYDTDGDGVIDHVVIFHAGADKSGGGGAQSYQAIWAHRGTVGTAGYVVDDRGTEDTSDDIRLRGYTMQYEDVGTGVLVHEFGHDLGLPDLYDVSGEGESSVVWWDLMSTGSHTGKLQGTMPTHMSAWSKIALGWAEPEVIDATSGKTEVDLGQTSNPPAGTEQAVRIDLPPSVATYTQLLPGSNQAWWSNNDQDWADVRLMRDVDLSGVTGAVSVSFDLDYVIEEDWDYLFLEASTDGGQSYTQLKGYDVATGAELTTPDSYTDPNGRLSDFGGLKYGYTGDSHGWHRVYHDLSSYAGQTIKLRIRYATDAAYLERGAFVDNILVTAGETVVLNDPVENSDLNGWTPQVTTFISGELLGEGWILSSGSQSFPLYYLLEWRNLDGYDRGLAYTYNTVFSRTSAEGADEWLVDHLPTNAPGMLVYLRDSRFGFDPIGANNSIIGDNNFFASPSEGAKGGLLVVDSHPDPLRGPRNGRISTSIGTYPFAPNNNWSGRVQSTNAAFTLQQTPGITLTVASGFNTPETTILTPTFYAPQAGVNGFHDSFGYYPGVESLESPVFTTATNARVYALVDPDSSAVVPAKGYYAPRTPEGYTGKSTSGNRYDVITNFSTQYYSPEFANYCSAGVAGLNAVSVIDIGFCGGADVTGYNSGNPGDSELQHGYHFKIVGQAADSSYGTIAIWKSNYAADLEANAAAGPVGTSFPVVVDVRNTGSPTTLTVYSDFDERAATYVEGSATNGAVPVRASAQQVEQAMRASGQAGIEALRVPADQAIAVVWISPETMAVGDQATFSYELTRAQPFVQITNVVFDQNFTDTVIEQIGQRLWVPLTTR